MGNPRRLKYKDGCGTYTITWHYDNTATVQHIYRGETIFKKSYLNVENAKRALSRYCGGMPKQVAY